MRRDGVERRPPVIEQEGCVEKEVISLEPHGKAKIEIRVNLNIRIS